MADWPNKGERERDGRWIEDLYTEKARTLDGSRSDLDTPSLPVFKLITRFISA